MIKVNGLTSRHRQNLHLGCCKKPKRPQRPSQKLLGPACHMVTLFVKGQLTEPYGITKILICPLPAPPKPSKFPIVAVVARQYSVSHGARQPSPQWQKKI